MCVSRRSFAHRQMFLKVGTLTQQPPHPAPTPTQGAPRPSPHTNQSEDDETAKRSEVAARRRGMWGGGGWTVKVPPSFRLLPSANFIIPVTRFYYKDKYERKEASERSVDPVAFYNAVEILHCEEFICKLASACFSMENRPRFLVQSLQWIHRQADKE